MKCINRVTLLGNIGNPPKIRFTHSGAAVTDLSVATHTFHKDKEGKWSNKTQWHKIVAWERLAEQCERLAKKGMLILVDGTIEYRKFLNKEGIEQRKAEITAQEIRFLNTKRTEDTNYDDQMVNKISAEEEVFEKTGS